ncbi:unnamed protein product [Pedinophyceae sp. YPF-701]|nr:unnamed protein product [Pedinophyceae sp. YPF-701]
MGDKRSPYFGGEWNKDSRLKSYFNGQRQQRAGHNAAERNGTAGAGPAHTPQHHFPHHHGTTPARSPAGGIQDGDPQCTICLEPPVEPAKPNGCQHVFCFKCLHAWSEITNVCPLCKCEFTLIKGFDGREAACEHRKQRSDHHDTLPDTACSGCGSTDNEDTMLLCDGCDCGWHLDCLGITWAQVREHFFCPTCFNGGRAARLNPALITTLPGINEHIVDAAVAAAPGLADAEAIQNAACKVCKSTEGEESMLLCDGCETGWHAECIDIPWERVKDLFFCPACHAHNRLPRASEIRDSITVLPRQWMPDGARWAAVRGGVEGATRGAGTTEEGEVDEDEDDPLRNWLQAAGAGQPQGGTRVAQDDGVRGATLCSDDDDDDRSNEYDEEDSFLVPDDADDSASGSDAGCGSSDSDSEVEVEGGSEGSEGESDEEVVVGGSRPRRRQRAMAEVAVAARRRRHRHGARSPAPVAVPSRRETRQRREEPRRAKGAAAQRGRAKVGTPVATPVSLLDSRGGSGSGRGVVRKKRVLESDSSGPSSQSDIEVVVHPRRSRKKTRGEGGSARKGPGGVAGGGEAGGQARRASAPDVDEPSEDARGDSPNVFLAFAHGRESEEGGSLEITPPKRPPPQPRPTPGNAAAFPAPGAPSGFTRAPAPWAAAPLRTFQPPSSARAATPAGAHGARSQPLSQPRSTATPGNTWRDALERAQAGGATQSQWQASQAASQSRYGAYGGAGGGAYVRQPPPWQTPPRGSTGARAPVFGGGGGGGAAEVVRDGGASQAPSAVECTPPESAQGGLFDRSQLDRLGCVPATPEEELGGYDGTPGEDVIGRSRGELAVDPTPPSMPRPALSGLGNRALGEFVFTGGVAGTMAPAGRRSGSDGKFRRAGQRTPGF